LTPGIPGPSSPTNLEKNHARIHNRFNLPSEITVQVIDPGYCIDTGRADQDLALNEI